MLTCVGRFAVFCDNSTSDSAAGGSATCKAEGSLNERPSLGLSGRRTEEPSVLPASISSEASGLVGVCLAERALKRTKG